MLINCKTDKGRVRATNEDYVLTFKGNRYSILIVADGMGGHNAGEVASKIAATTVRDYIFENINSYQDKEDLVRDAILKANREVFNTAETNEEYRGMGTTTTCCLICEDKLYLGHVGDSRAYIVNEKGAKRISEDHSFVQELINKGSITENEALTHPKRNLVTRSVGTEEYVVVDTRIENFNRDDFVLLCSDGLTTYATNEEIYKLLLNKGINALDELISLANQRGGSDNISIIIARKDDEV